MLFVLRRLLVPTVLALSATIVLLTVMRSLVRVGSSHLEAKAPRVAIDFVRTRRSEAVETKNRERPQKVTTPVQAWAPSIAASNSKSASAVRVPIQTAHAAQPGLSLAGGPTLGAGSADGDVMPLVRVSPLYPPRAQARGIEGWVWLEFTITHLGTTKEIRILDSDPKGLFDRAATNAVKKYKYKPRVENGEPVDRPGVQVVLSFDIVQ